MRYFSLFPALLVLSACGRGEHVGRAPDFSEIERTTEHDAMLFSGLPLRVEPPAPPITRSSLWRGDKKSLLGDRRALERGDILTVVIEIDESAEISNSTARSREGSESLGIPQLFGWPQKMDENLPEGASMGEGVAIDSASSARGGDPRARRAPPLTDRPGGTASAGQ